MAYIGKSPDGTGVRSRFYYTQTSGGGTSVTGSSDDGTTLTFSDGAYVDVYLNGVLLVAGTDYNTSTANTIAGLAALANGDVVEVVVYDIFTVADTVSSLNGGTFSNNVTINGDLTVDTNTLFVDASANEVGIGTITPATYTDYVSGSNAPSVVVAGSQPSYVLTDTDETGNAGTFGITKSGTSTTFNNIGSGQTKFFNNGGERLRIGDDVRVINSSDADALHLFEFDGSNNATASLYAANGDNNVKLHSSGDSFFTGRLAVGTDSVPNQFIVYRSAGDIVNVRTGRTDTSNVGMIVFKDGSNQTCGQITSRGSDNTTSYNTSSDHRLKQSVTDMTGAIDRVKTLLPKRFSFINDTTNTMQDGFLAHEAQTVVPQSVIGTHNETREVSNAVLLASGKLYAEDVTQEDWTANKGDDENDLYPSDSTWAASHTAPVYQQIDHSKLVPLLTGALQEAIAKIETLETKVAALEAGE